ncbi:MAG TPA: ATP-binding protein [bacterium]|nr:ATP-binding protein [bacterium]
MRLRLGIFTKIFLAVAGLALVPLFIGAALITSIYQDLVDQIVYDVVHVASPATANHLMGHIADVHQNAYTLMFFILLISILLVSFAALYLSRSFSSPIRALLDASRHIARGELDVRLSADRSDEFGLLAGEFNAMASQLEEAQENLERDNIDLERRVAERTAELTMANVELRSSAAQIQEANRLKSEFLANVSHELRTPLNAILGYTDLMLDGIYGEMQKPQLESLTKVRRNAESLLRLINDILDLSKIEAGRMSLTLEKFDPGELVRSSLESVQPLFARSRLELRADIADGLPTVEADRGKVQQALYNLLSNALKFTSAGGVTVRVYADEKRVNVWFEVIDTGPGIEAAKLRSIFDQFRQIDGSTTRTVGGAGLGLALCKKLVNLLNGTIDVSSEPGKGSAFRFSIPVVAATKGALPRQRQAEAAPGGKRTVLAIDDAAEVLELLAASLEPAGFEVIRCTDAERAVERVRETNPFAVTLDIMMPYRDGWSVLKELKADPQTSDIPVIIVSIIDDRARGYSMGVADYMLKPINRAQLIKRLESFAGGDEWREDA